jgi:hypothetical protein
VMLTYSSEINDWECHLRYYLMKETNICQTFCSQGDL